MSAYGENLVSNGGFYGSASGWELSGGAVWDASGKISCPTSGDSYKTISQPLNIVPGLTYIVEYYLDVISPAVTSSVSLGDVGCSNGDSSGEIRCFLTPLADGFITISIETGQNGEATVDEISVREVLSSESESFISSETSSSVASESSSVESQTTSLLPSNSSLSSQTYDDASSESSSLMFSSLSSQHGGALSFPFNVTIEKENPVWCFKRAEDYIYAGTGPDGKILRTSNLSTWEEWNSVNDSHVRCLEFYANGLWIGTEPNGYVWVYNFTTDSFYPYVKTADHCVSSMAVYNDRLYVGTSPWGYLYSFDGKTWREEKEFYGGGITSLFSQGDSLYVSLRASETLMVYNGGKWSGISIKSVEIPEDLTLKGSVAIEAGDAMQTIASMRKLATEPMSRQKEAFFDRIKISSVSSAVYDGVISENDAREVIPLNPECNLTSINEYDGQLVFGGKKGVVYGYSDETVKPKYDNNNLPIVNITSNGFFCTEKDLYHINPEGSET